MVYMTREPQLTPVPVGTPLEEACLGTPVASLTSFPVCIVLTSQVGVSPSIHFRQTMAVMAVTLARDPLTLTAGAQKLSQVPGETHPGVLSTKECMDANMVVYLISNQVSARCLSFSM